MKTINYTLILLIALQTVMCSEPNTPQIEHLNGYWEISRVELADGTVKEFSISTTVDFIEIKDTLGIRTKVNPQLDGTFITADDFETFRFTSEGDLLQLHYATEFNTWSETILTTTDSTFSALNKDQKIYHYKRFKPFNLTTN